MQLGLAAMSEKAVMLLYSFELHNSCFVRSAQQGIATGCQAGVPLLSCFVCTGIKKQHPQLWRDVKLGLHEQDQLTVYLEVMSAADAVRLPGAAASP